MKSLKRILIFCLCVISVFFSACKNPGKDPDKKPPQQTPTETSLTILEAKEIIVNALSLESGSVGYAKKYSNQGNRNVYEKFKNFKIDIAGIFDENDYYQNYVGMFGYSDGSYQKVILDADVLAVGELENRTLKGYSPTGSELYTFDSKTNNYMKYDNYQNGIRETLFNELDTYVTLCDLLFSNVMFSDMSFDHLFKNDDVKKVLSNEGFSIEMSVDVYALAYIFENTRWGDPFEFDMDEYLAYVDAIKEFGEEYVVSITDLKILFNNDGELESITWNFHNKEGFGGVYYQTHYSVNLVKLDQEISTPTWFDIENYS